MLQRNEADIIRLVPASATGDIAEHGSNPAGLVPAAPETASVGRRLAAAREARGLSYEAVFDAIKVKVAHLAAIEAGDRAALPAAPFTAGFLKAYARFLGLDADELSSAYRAEIAPAPTAPAAAAATPVERPANPSPGRLALPREKMVSLLGLIAALFCILWIAARVILPNGSPEAPERRVVADGRRPASAPAAAVEAPAPAASVSAADDLRPEPPAQATKPVAPAADRVELAPARDAAARPSPAAIEPAPAELLETNQLTAAVIEPTVAAISDDAPEAAPAASAAPAEDSPIAPTDVETRLAPAPAAEPTIVKARAIRSVAPKYPERCAAGAAVSESVALAFDVTAEGRAANARVETSSNSCFHSAALAALGRMRFSPRTIDGRPSVETGKGLTVQFDLP